MGTEKPEKTTAGNGIDYEQVRLFQTSAHWYLLRERKELPQCAGSNLDTSHGDYAGEESSCNDCREMIHQRGDEHPPHYGLSPVTVSESHGKELSLVPHFREHDEDERGKIGAHGFSILCLELNFYAAFGFHGKMKY